MDKETLSKGLSMAKVMEKLQEQLDFVNDIASNEPKSNSLSGLTLHIGSGNGKTIFINGKKPLLYDLKDEYFPEEFNPATECIVQALDAAVAVIENGLEKANKIIEKEFSNLKPIEDDSKSN